jgi:hypothetical protein
MAIEGTLMSLFGTSKVSKGTVDQVATMVHHYFKSRGMDPALQELDAKSSASGYGWWLMQGSAKTYIFVQETDSGPVLRITSPIVRVPQANREAFFRRLLEANASLSGCALSLHEDVVLVVAQRHTSALDQVELDDLVWNCAYVADTLDNVLADEFGAKMYVD